LGTEVEGVPILTTLPYAVICSKTSFKLDSVSVVFHGILAENKNYSLFKEESFSEPFYMNWLDQNLWNLTIWFTI
jgi:hypothetical protein